MAAPQKTATRRPINVASAKGSAAERFFRERGGLPGLEEIEPEAIAPGVRPSPRHDLRFHGGKIIPDLTYTNLYVGGSSSWLQSDIQNIDQTLAAAMSDPHLNNVMVQYFHGRPITTTFKPSQILSGSKPSAFSQGDVEALISQLHAQGRLASFDLSSTVFNFMLPSGTILNTNTAPTQKRGGGEPAARESAARAKGGGPENPVHPEEEASSLGGLGGYHGSVHVSNDTLYYAVGVFSETLSNGRSNGIVAFGQPWKNVVATFYHELNEARTDADVEDAIKAGNDPSGGRFLGWVSRQGEECGDFPMAEVGPHLRRVMKQVLLTDGSRTVPVQFQYSNSVHGPEGPIAAPHITHALARRLRRLHKRQALRARQHRLRRALRALRQGRVRLARRIEAKLFPGARLVGLVARRQRLRRALRIAAQRAGIRSRFR
jgi:hypothetical protein